MEIVETMIKSRGITAEHTSIEEMIDEAKVVENTIQVMEYFSTHRGVECPRYPGMAHYTRPVTQEEIAEVTVMHARPSRTVVGKTQIEKI